MSTLKVALAGAGAFGYLAVTRGETISALWVVAAALCTYLIAYRYYSAFIAAKVVALDDAPLIPIYVSRTQVNAIVPDVGERLRMIDVAEKGALFLEITSHGKAAHGSRPRRPRCPRRTRRSRSG